MTPSLICRLLMVKKTNKTVYYYPENHVSNLGNLYIFMEKNINSPIKDTYVGECPAWNHQNSRTFTHYASVNLDFHYDLESQSLSSTIDPSLHGDYFDTFPIKNENAPLVHELRSVYTNFYWTEDKNIWISILPHPLSSFNNNFYHVGAQFNLSNWARMVNIGMVVVDPKKPISIKRGDPLYTVKFHTEDQNEEVDLIYREPPEQVVNQTENKITFVRSLMGKGFNYNKVLFETNPQEKESKCPFSFLWKK